MTSRDRVVVIEPEPELRGFSSRNCGTDFSARWRRAPRLEGLSEKRRT